MDHKGWYDRKSKEKPFNIIEDITFVSAMGPTGGGRNSINPRFQRHFNVITYTDLQAESMDTIFNTIINAFYFNFSQEIKNSIAPLIEITLKVYDNVQCSLLPTPKKVSLYIQP
jgi:dynein heavy chain